MKQIFFKIASNSLLIVFAALASIVSCFSDDVKGIVKQYLPIINENYIKITLFLVTFCVLIVLFTIVGYVSKLLGKKPLVYHGTMQNSLWQDGSGERIEEFRLLRSDTTSSLFVMGIGMTYFSKDLDYLSDLLGRNINVKLLMIAPDFVDNIMKADEFNRYFVRDKYATDIRTSYERLYNFIVKRKKQSSKDGSVVLNVYKDLIPINVTIINEGGFEEAYISTKKGKMLIEWCFPYSDWRWASRLSRAGDKGFYQNVCENIKKIWDCSDYIIDDKPYLII